MARVVVLSFGDNDAAEHFIESLWAAQEADDNKTATEELSREIIATGAIAAACGTVEALVARPTMWCKCKIVGKSRGSSRGKFSALTEQWGRTERYGWFVHRRCNKPNYYIVTRFIRNMIIGTGGNNLLPELDARLYPPSADDIATERAENRTSEELAEIRSETDPKWTEDVITSL
jgi:hypothetical protein